LPDFTSMTERTNPVTSDPFTAKAVFWPRCWSYRQRRATFASVVANVCMFYPKTMVRRTFPGNADGSNGALGFQGSAIQPQFRPRTKSGVGGMLVLSERQAGSRLVLFLSQ
jgi:hypothetical protein